MQAVIDEPIAGAVVGPDRLRVSGWIFDESGPLERALIVIGQDAPARVVLGGPRPDVADAHPSVPHAFSSGFHCDLDLRTAGAGPVRIDLLALTRQGRWQLADRVEVELARDDTLVEPRRRGAAFTVVQNEPVMLPLWLDYYGRHFAAEDLYVLDHDSSDGSTDAVGSRCRVIPIHRAASFDHRWLRSTVEAFQAFLLRSYDTVLFAEADEFIVADPRHYAGLADYMSRLEAPAARCAGFNVVQQPDEGPLNHDAPILQQRRYWHASRLYSKRLISRIPLRWAEGFHAEFEAPDTPPDPSLLLVHLHRVDYELCLERHRASATRNWSREDIGRGDGWQNRIHELDEFEDWFRRGRDLESPRELVPDHLRSAL